MNKNALRQFLVDSNKAGYAGGEEKKWIKETDGSTTIPFKKGPNTSMREYGLYHGVIEDQLPDQGLFDQAREENLNAEDN